MNWVGPIQLAFHGDPSYSWASAPTPAGTRRAQISGLIEWEPAHQLAEFMGNPERRVTVGADVGILEFLWAEDPLRRPFNGWYLLEDFDLDGDQPSSVSGVVGFRLAGIYLGPHRQVALAHSGRDRNNTVGVTAKDRVVSPFRPHDDEGDRFARPPGGTFATREYDASPGYDLDDDGVPVEIGFYAGPVGGLAPIAFPEVSDPPTWLAQRGGDVRAYDRREEREVYGPSHPFVETTDLAVTNGHLRYWVGNRLLAPFLNVQAYADGAWREAGYLMLADPLGSAVLLGARLRRLTPELGTVVLTVRNQGEVMVTLRRGERMLRVQHGDASAPSATRLVRWTGVPPWTRLSSATQAPATFGQGVFTARL